jgi:Uma2 family endonuclease
MWVVTDIRPSISGRIVRSGVVCDSFEPMSVAMRKSMSLEEFLAWEERQEPRWEFDGFAPVAMTGGTVEQGLIQANLIQQLGNRLQGTPCRALGSHVKISVAGSIRYPDALVVCTPSPRRATVISAPVVVFEILSPSTASVDSIIKNQEYRDTPSIRHYVMLQQDTIGAMVFSREGNDWVGHVLSGNVTIPLPAIGIELPLTELYEGVTFAEPDTAA